MNIRKIIKEEVDDFEWVTNVDDRHSLINKAFHFNPIAVQGDGDYRKLCEYLVSLGIVSMYNSPIVLEGGDEVVGVFVYREKNDGPLSYVYTEAGSEGEDYFEHIKEFADFESGGGLESVEVVDAREFVKDMGL